MKEKVKDGKWPEMPEGYDREIGVTVPKSPSANQQRFDDYFNHSSTAHQATAEETEEPRPFEQSSTNLQILLQEYLCNIFDDCNTADDVNRTTALFFVAMRKALEPLKEFIESDDFNEFQAKIPDITNWLESDKGTKSLASLLLLGQFLQEIGKAMPYLLEELDSIGKNEEKKGHEEMTVTMNDFLDLVFPSDENGRSYLKEILQRVNDRIENDALEKRILNDLPQLQAVTPKYHVTPNAKLANSMQKTEILEGTNELEVMVANANKRGEITTAVTIDYAPKGNVKLSGPQKTKYTEYDRQVLDAIVSLWLYGDESHVFTPAMLYRAMTGSAVDDISPQQAGAITKSIDKMARLRLTVDATDEVRAVLKRKGVTDIDDVESYWDDAFISIKKFGVRNGNKEITAFKLHAEPPLYTYSKAVGQILTVPAKLLDIKKITKNGSLGSSVANTEKRIAIKGYLIRRIQVMKRDRKNKAPKQQPTILFETLFQDVDIVKADAKTDARKYVLTVLDYWTATKFIKGYEIRKKGRSIDAVSIIL